MLYDDLGRKQKTVLAFEQEQADGSSRQISVDNHIINCKSEENDLAEKGYIFYKTKEEQNSLIMAYGIYAEMLGDMYEVRHL